MVLLDKAHHVTFRPRPGDRKLWCAFRDEVFKAQNQHKRKRRSGCAQKTCFLLTLLGERLLPLIKLKVNTGTRHG